MTNEDLLAQWEKESQERSIRHHEEARRLARWDAFLTVPSLVWGSLSGAALISESPEVSKNTRIVSFVSALTLSFQRMANISNKKEKHSFYSNEYEKLARELSVERANQASSGRTYANMATLVRECQSQYDRLNDRAPGFN